MLAPSTLMRPSRAVLVRLLGTGGTAREWLESKIHVAVDLSLLILLYDYLFLFVFYLRFLVNDQFLFMLESEGAIRI